MKKVLFAGLVLLLLVAAGTAVGQEQAQSGDQNKAVSYENWKAAKATAEKYDNEGKYVEALQYYLEYARQAEGLGNQELVAWGKNNAAFMIIKRHKQDASVDLAPAKKLIEEGMAIATATEDCKKCLATNLEYVNLFLKK
jgi:curli biogenesis system outer membrane secretion channel CsgG